jgi:hypothetical protein
MAQFGKQPGEINILRRKMYSVNNTSRVLGAAFLLQAVTNLVSNACLIDPLIVPGNIISTMTNFANNAMQVRTGILGDMVTALGIIFLGAILFVILRKQNEKIALVALGFYILEAALLAVSKLSTFSLLRISQESVIAGHPAYLQSLGNLALDTMHFGFGALAMLAFCLGAILFYYLLDKSRIVPRVVSLWGLITVTPCLIATLFNLFGYEVPFFVYLPYVPFEFFIGPWILVKGLRVGSDAK